MINVPMKRLSHCPSAAPSGDKRFSFLSPSLLLPRERLLGSPAVSPLAAIRLIPACPHPSVCPSAALSSSSWSSSSSSPKKSDGWCSLDDGSVCDEKKSSWTSSDMLAGRQACAVHQVCFSNLHFTRRTREARVVLEVSAVSLPFC